MLFHTHLLLGVALFLLASLFFPELYSVISLLFVLFGSILPDIDERNSKMNQWSGILGRVIAFFFKHRGFFHSLPFLAIPAGLLWYAGFWKYGLALSVGFFAHLIGDGITPMGIRPFYPFSSKVFRGPIRVGGMMEMIILLGLIVVVLVQFW